MSKNRKNDQKELPIIQQMYDLIIWYVPLLNKLPRDHKFALGDRIAGALYDSLEDLIFARYSTEKLGRLEQVNYRLDVVRYQTRMLKDFDLMDARRYGHVSKLINEIGHALGGWIGQQKAMAR